MIGRIVEFFKQVVEDNRQYHESELLYHKKRMERKIKSSCPKEQLEEKLRILQQNFCKSVVYRHSQNNPNSDED
jgi:hypothetical protein